MHMATNATLEQNNLEDEITGMVVHIGCACSTDLASQIGKGVSADDLLPILETLVKKGTLRHKVDPSDPRKYADRYQTVYEPDPDRA